MLENKTNRLQSMNDVFLDLLKNQQKISRKQKKMGLCGHTEKNMKKYCKKIWLL